MLIINILKNRKEPVKHEKYLQTSTSNVINIARTKLYDYYFCDYCGNEIKLDTKKENTTGGIVEIPQTLTKCGKLKLALHNKCLNKVIKELENKEINK